ncbi:GNAT family N-acetyltransferase, partial [Kocuria oceani]
APCMAAAVRLARRTTPVISLYVNDYNTRALATYERVGFRRVGTFATVLL